MIPKPEHIGWTRRTFDMLRNGGRWGVPRSGLIFEKRSGTSFALVAKMPHMREMPITAEQLAEQQQSDFNIIKQHCEVCGIVVTDATIPAGPPVFYECGICDHCHPWNWHGDCRDDANRFTHADLDARFGPNGWIERSMDDRVAADKQS